MFEENEIEQVQEQVEQPTAPVESAQDRNFRELRERNKQIERERDEERRRNAQLQETLNRQMSIAQPQQERQPRMSRDDIPDVGYVDDQLADIREEQRKERERIAFAHAELKVAQQYPDYQKALSDDHINALMAQEPELWSSISANKDPYARMISAMKAVKSTGIYQKEEVTPERKAAQANSTKPKAINSLNPSSGGTGALAQAHNFTGRTFSSEQERDDVYQTALRRARGG